MLKNFLKATKRLLQPKASSFDKYIRTPLPIQEDLLKYFSRNSRLVVFDIGSCEGEDSIRYAKLFPNATIYSSEPLENNYNKILSNINKEQCTSIKPYKLALSDKKGVAQLYISSGHPPHKPNKNQWDHGNKSSSLLEPGNAWEVTGGKHLRWTSGDEVRKRVPARSGWQRVGDFFYRWLPIESQL